MRFLHLSFLILAFFATFVLSGKYSKSSESDESNDSEKPKCSFIEIFRCKEEATCDNLNTLDTRTITKTCSCVCRTGFVRINGDCVQKSKCTDRYRRSATDCSDPNEKYLYCGSKCPARCGDKPGERVCTTDCVKGCFCKKGLILNKKNKCVLPNKC